MGLFTFDFPDELTKQMEALEKMCDADGVKKMLEAGAEVVEDEMLSQLEGYKDTGSLIGSVKATTVDKNDQGYYTVIRPTGKDSKGVRNMAKLVYLHYGTSRQPATGIVTKIVNRSSDKAVAAMQEVFDREVGA